MHLQDLQTYMDRNRREFQVRGWRPRQDELVFWCTEKPLVRCYCVRHLGYVEKDSLGVPITYGNSFKEDVTCDVCDPK